MRHYRNILYYLYNVIVRQTKEKKLKKQPITKLSHHFRSKQPCFVITYLFEIVYNIKHLVLNIWMNSNFYLKFKCFIWLSASVYILSYIDNTAISMKFRFISINIEIYYQCQHSFHIWQYLLYNCNIKRRVSVAYNHRCWAFRKLW